MGQRTKPKVRVKKIPVALKELRDYDELSTKMAQMNRTDRALELRKFHQLSVSQLIEYVCTEIRLMDLPPDPEQARSAIIEHVVEAKPGGPMLNDNRTALRRAEAMLLAAGVTSVKVPDVARFYDNLDGIDYMAVRETETLELMLQPGKWKYE